jgi:hypothetical protein
MSGFILFGGLATSTKRHEAESGSLALRLTGLLPRFPPDGLLHPAPVRLHARTSNLHGELLSVHKIKPGLAWCSEGHKTDDKDGWWLAHLLRHAMIHPSFIPPRAIRELRDLTLRRKRLLSNVTAEKNRIQKVLEDANVKLGNVLSDVFGVSGQLMLEAY